jgi:predicted ferric reductase
MPEYDTHHAGEAHSAAHEVSSIEVAMEDYKALSDSEIEAFFQDLDKDKNGFVDFGELEKKLHEVHEELAPDLKRHHITHPSRRDLEKNESHSRKGDGLHAFLCQLLPECDAKISKEDFIVRVRRLRVPSQKQTDSNEQDKGDKEKERELPMRRRIRAYWAVHGPTILFMTFVVALTLGFSLWQGLIYFLRQRYRDAYGLGVGFAKLAAGALYPVLFFMLLSMSRHFSTFLRRNYIISRFINWDLSQEFHIRMSIAGLVLASMHAIAHLSGTLVHGSRASNQEAIAGIQGPDSVSRTYGSYVRSLPGWTGIVALLCFWIISLCSMPFIRGKSYEIFQLGHLLMFPMIGMLCAHGTAMLLQHPMLGYWLAFPTLLVLFERGWRFLRGFMSVPARVKILDTDAVLLVCKHPSGKDWKYNAGQYILLQVPDISFFQWHPFTVSYCKGDVLHVHIKFEGDWTTALKDLSEDRNIRVGIDGPFGAPAQRFYDYSHSIIIGGGIGITPFSAILADLEDHFTGLCDPWAERRHSHSFSISHNHSHSRAHSKARDGTSQPGSRPISRSNSKPPSRRVSRTREGRRITLPPSSEIPTSLSKRQPPFKHPSPARRVDFHWTVREKNNLLWFSDLLNRTISGAQPLAHNGDLELNIHTHITAKRKNISTHVFRYLLDSYRTEAAPYSALTGLKQPSHFGRPDFDDILERHFEEIVEAGITEKKIGVFVSFFPCVIRLCFLFDLLTFSFQYCGTPVVGEILSDRCHMLTAKARDNGLKIKYEFMMEVFG